MCRIVYREFIENLEPEVSWVDKAVTFLESVFFHGAQDLRRPVVNLQWFIHCMKMHWAEFVRTNQRYMHVRTVQHVLSVGCFLVPCLASFFPVRSYSLQLFW